MTASGPLYLSQKDVQSLLKPKMAVDLCEEALLAMGKGDVDWCAPRLMELHSPIAPVSVSYKACVLRSAGVIGTRVFSTGGACPDSGDGPMGPTRVVLLSDLQTGALLAIIDERWSYALRTGASAAVAAKYLALTEDSPIIGILGAGHIAEAALSALVEVCRPSEVRVFSPPPDEREAFARKMTDRLHLPVRAVASAEEAVRGGMIICAATSAMEPFIREAWLAPGSFLYSLGSRQEAETAIYQQTKFIVDDWEQVKLKVDIKQLLASGAIAPSDVVADLAGVVSGQQPGREADEDRIFVRSQGLVPQDITIANAIFQLALAHGIGQRLSADHGDA